ncbi:Allatotropin [Eumeta japonica]|uniref:Allatotropin n=1 Tax=Eumeta variegata TaxID=151549 RepID=A0A4C1UD27_EUMVA|nr:Allatotropin [Eumeta japonica]
MLAGVVLAWCVCAAAGAPDSRLARKQQRPTRGFKNVEMMTARGFGKRDRAPTRAQRDVRNQPAPAQRSLRGTPIFKSPSVGIARDFGKRAPEEIQDGGVQRPKFNPKSNLLVATGFGKRSFNSEDSDEVEGLIRTTRGNFNPHTSKVLIARGFGKRQDDLEGGVYGLDNFWELLDNTPERESQEFNEEKTLESIPVDWFVSELLNNPEFARTVVRKFIDLNQVLNSDKASLINDDVRADSVDVGSSYLIV